MRTRSTNYLQGAILLTGAVYILFGVFMYLVPLTVLTFFAENISENWLEMVRENELVAPLYYITRGLSALLLTSGLAMILPLFDPLRYRGLIYFNGVVFPLLGLILSLTQYLFSGGEAGSANPALSLNLFLFVTLTIVFAFNFSGLMITKKLAKEGVE